MGGFPEEALIELRLKLEEEVTRWRRKQCPRQGHSKVFEAGRKQRRVTGGGCREDDGGVRHASPPKSL